ncbi:hypothetical protein KUM42_14615 [Modestobacter sp. L9-4]|jgi:hypothetical protein|uniref:hypothetical protein n=1 Tax=Modestobacter sp. L9-4 TaxID=2851567 RepID=UPI001C766925|nr:hypothetical protein [Modestobacter sp. L9-4]QXG75066.1 hypothetical protein KUM42_14615 [Modestobacter sp. L9-4]
MSVPPAAEPDQVVLVPHWLTAVDRSEVERAVTEALEVGPVHPVAAIHLGDVLTELHVAAAREVVWPAPVARVRRATGWGADVVPVRLSALELASVLSLPGLASVARAALTGGRSA